MERSAGASFGRLGEGPGGNLLGTFRRPPSYRWHLQQSSGEPWGTFAGTLVNVRELILNLTFWARQTSLAMLRQSSHEGARMIPVYPGTCLNLCKPGVSYPGFRNL